MARHTIQSATHDPDTQTVLVTYVANGDTHTLKINGDVLRLIVDACHPGALETEPTLYNARYLLDLAGLNR